MPFQDRQVYSGSLTGNIINPKRPLLAERTCIDIAHDIHAHRHVRGQFIFTSKGNIRLNYRHANWHLDAHSIAWIPSGHHHAVSANGPVAYSSVFLDADVCTLFGSSPAIFRLTPLVRELTLKASEFSPTWKAGSPEERLANVLIDQLMSLSPSDLAIPLPADVRFRQQIQSLLAKPDIRITAQQVADDCHMSCRSFERHFRNQTGISFGQWLRRLIIQRTIELINNGSSVKSAALQFGYRNLSAFTAMFRRETGMSPTRWLQDHGQIP